MDLAIVHRAQGSSKVPFHANIILLIHIVLYCGAIVSQFRLHQAGVQLGEKAFWTKVIQIPPDRRNPRSQGKDASFPEASYNTQNETILIFYAGRTEHRVFGTQLYLPYMIDKYVRAREMTTSRRKGSIQVAKYRGSSTWGYSYCMTESLQGGVGTPRRRYSHRRSPVSRSPLILSLNRS